MSESGRGHTQQHTCTAALSGLSPIFLTHLALAFHFNLTPGLIGHNGNGSEMNQFNIETPKKIKAE